MKISVTYWSKTYSVCKKIEDINYVTLQSTQRLKRNGCQRRKETGK